MLIGTCHRYSPMVMVIRGYQEGDDSAANNTSIRMFFKKKVEKKHELVATEAGEPVSWPAS